jgi:glucokinase
MTPQLALAVDIGGTKVETALVAADGTVIPGSRHREPTGRTLPPAAFLESLGRCIDRSMARAADGDVVGIGIGSAGPVDIAAGRIRPKNLPLLHGLGVRDEVARRVGLRTRLRLDGTCIALAEAWVGANRTAASSMSLVVSTGIGGGIVVDGRILSGRTGNAGHVGQIHVRDPDRTTEFDGTLEGIASGPSSVAWAQRRGWAGSTGEDLGRSALAGDAVARDAIQRSATAVGTAIADVATLLDIDAFAIGGGFSHVTDWYLGAVRDAARAGAVFDYSRDVAVRATGLDTEGPLIGAAALVHRSSLLSEVPAAEDDLVPVAR